MQNQSGVLTLRCGAVPGATGDAGELDVHLEPQRRPAQPRLPFEPPSGSSTLPGQSSSLHTAPDALHAICTICKAVAQKLTITATVGHMQGPDVQSAICATLDHSLHEL